MKSKNFISSGAKCYGSVEVGYGTIIEGGVVIGHPIQKIIDKTISDGGQFSNMESLYDKCAIKKTIIGNNCIIRSGTVIYNGSVLKDHVDIAHNCIIREGSTIESYTRILPNTSIRQSVSIGIGCRVAGVLGDRSVLKSYCTSMGALVHEFKVGVSGKIEPAPVLETGCVVGRTAVVIGGVNIGEYALIGAGAVVRKNVEPYSIVIGKSFEVVGKRSEEDVKRIQQVIKKGCCL